MVDNMRTTHLSLNMGWFAGHQSWKPGGPPIRAWPRSSHAKWWEMTVLPVALGIGLKRFKVGLSHICEVLYIFDHQKHGHENISQMNAHPVFRHHIFRVHSFQMSSTHGMWLRLWLMCDRMCFNIFNSNGSTCQSNAGMHRQFLGYAFLTDMPTWSDQIGRLQPWFLRHIPAPLKSS